MKGPSHLKSPPEHLWSGAGRVLLRGACSQAQPSLQSRAGWVGGCGLCHQETSTLRLPGPLGLHPPTQSTPHSGMYLCTLSSTGCGLASLDLVCPQGTLSLPLWALTSCPSALKAALLLWSALLTSPPLSSSLPPQGSAPCPVSPGSHLGCPPLRHTQRS